LLVLDLSPAALNHTILRLAVPVREGSLDVDPLAFIPKTPLDLAALGHLEAVQRVAVAPEQTRDKVILATEFTSSKVELLPPILMVTVF